MRRGARRHPGAGRGATAVVIVDTGSGAHQSVIHFDGSISGLAALQLAGANPVTIGYGSLGQAVCQLYGVGDPAVPGQCPGGWVYYRAVGGASGWTSSGLGASNTSVRRRRRRGLEVRRWSTTVLVVLRGCRLCTAPDARAAHRAARDRGPPDGSARTDRDGRPTFGRLRRRELGIGLGDACGIRLDGELRIRIGVGLGVTIGIRLERGASAEPGSASPSGQPPLGRDDRHRGEARRWHGRHHGSVRCHVDHEDGRRGDR